MLCVALLVPRAAVAASAGGVSLSSGPLSRPQLVTRLCLWFCLFTVAAMFAGAETAITTLWPWKVKQLAASGGKGSPFAALEKDITKVLTTVLVGVTFCTIFGTALATDVAVGLFGKAGVGYATLAITAVTLFFGEILPKSLAVAMPEAFARFTLPAINFFTLLLTPLSALTGFVNDLLLKCFGVGDNDRNDAVTQPELRMVLSSASQSGAVEVYEQDMIEGVLDLQRSQVQQIMTPRVELVAVDRSASLADLLDLTMSFKYSRVPVFNDTVDEIIGVVLTRELLAFAREHPDDVASNKSRVNGQPLGATNVTVIMEPVGFIPESMTTMNALKQMRRQRAHMMVVVDEFGGTSGIVTLEDILETLVGEIYDEDDEEEVKEDTSMIVFDEPSGTYVIDGMANLDIVAERLHLEDEIDEELLAEFATLSGFLCQQAGEIPDTGISLLVERSDETAVRFEVLQADERRLLSLKASNVTFAANTDGKPTEVVSPFVLPLIQDPDDITEDMIASLER